MSAESGVDPLNPGDPQALGAYRLVGRIGRGGMGTVYLAESSAGERAAVKVINPDLAHDPSFRDRFRREVESARRVRRFCTAPVLDANLDGDPLYIVTEYVNGPNLHEFVRDSGPMRGATLDHPGGGATARTAIPGARGGPRDLKPANVLLSSLGPRVIDFGIARALDTVVDQTKTGQFVGTPAYMAPEIIGGGRATAASDVFAWGAVVAFAGTGDTPFPGTTLPAILYRISHGEPQIEGLEDELRRLVGRALAKDPASRPSAQELLDGLVGQERADTAQTADTLRRTWQAQPPAGPPPGGPPGGPPPGGPYPSRPTRADGSGTLLAPPGPPGGSNGPTAPVPSGRPPGGTPGRPNNRANSRTLAVAGAIVAGFLVLALLAVLWLSGSSGPPTNTSTVFSDDFSSSNTRWQGGDYAPIFGTGYLNGRYRLGTTGSDTEESSVAPYDKELPPQALVTADVTPVSGPKYGQVGLWCFGANDSNLDGYVFLVRLDGDGTVIRKVSGSNISKELAPTSVAKGFKTQGANKIQIACEQQDKKMHLRMWLNGQLATEYTDGDNPLTRGTAGVVVMRQGGGSGGQMAADYDNFDISRINQK